MKRVFEAIDWPVVVILSITIFILVWLGKVMA
jgi:hypothetical protein